MGIIHCAPVYMIAVKDSGMKSGSELVNCRLMMLFRLIYATTACIARELEFHGFGRTFA